MLIPELIARLHEFIGREASVDGVLLVGADSRVVADADRPDQACLLLPHPQVSNRLVKVVPAWGGGRYIYVEDATVVGVLASDPLRFVTVRAVIVRRDGKVYEFEDLA